MKKLTQTVSSTTVTLNALSKSEQVDIRGLTT